MPNKNLRSRRNFLIGSGALVIALGLGIAPPAMKLSRRVRHTLAGSSPSTLAGWLIIGADNIVTIYTGRVDLGTGVVTALTQIVADELDVAVSQVRLVQGDTASTPDQGGTWASTTISYAGQQLRQAAATARQILLSRAAERLSVSIDALQVEAGHVSSASGKAAVSYSELVDGVTWEVPIDPAVSPKAQRDYAVVGKPIQRPDIASKVFAKFEYVHDVKVDNMAHGRVIRPRPGQGTQLNTVDESSIAGMAGLIKIVRRGNFVGVVAETEWQAVQAAQQLNVTWSNPVAYPPHDEIYDQLRSDQTKVMGNSAAIQQAAGRLLANQSDPMSVVKFTADSFRPVAERELVSLGEPNTVLSQAQINLEADYHWPFQAHASLAPSCAVAHVESGQATIWSGTQHPHGLQEDLAYVLNLSVDRVRIVYTPTAGTYGRMAADDAAADAALLSQAVGRPVRVQWTRADEHSWAFMGPAMTCKVSGAVDEAGQVVAWTYEFWSPSHFVPPLLIDQLNGWSLGPAFSDGNIPNIYDIPNRHILLHAQPTSLLRYGNLRGLAAPAATFAAESFIDELAVASNQDPLALRLSLVFEPRARTVLETVAALSEWGAERDPSSSPSEARGRGLGLAVYGGTWVAIVVDIAVDLTNYHISVEKVFVAHDCGLIINPDGVKNQIEGNVIQTISRTLKEEVRFSQGVEAVDWQSYPILTFEELPQIDIELVDGGDMPAFGAGEPASVPIAAAIGNAIYDATQVRLRQIPFTPERLEQALS